jgi:hypothetical protein
MIQSELLGMKFRPETKATYQNLLVDKSLVDATVHLIRLYPMGH